MKLKTENKVVGLNQSLKAIEEGKADTVFLADDSDAKVQNSVIELCERFHVEIYHVDTMKNLGKACDIGVKAAVSVLLK